jgi:small lipoprotein (TIGR04452 family)
MKHYIILILFLIQCTGTDYGIPGPNVVSREQAVGELNGAMTAKVAVCGATSANVILLSRVFLQNPRKVLDGAYYAKKDIEACKNQIYLTSCSTLAPSSFPYPPCNLSPKGITDGGGFLQGGF